MPIWKSVHHPGFVALSRYVDRGEDSADWTRIRSHLRDCVRCRDEVTWIRRLQAEARKLPDAEPPPELIEQILARRAAGERGILPVDPMLLPPSRRSTKRLVGAAAVAASLVGLVVVMGPERVVAGSNNLRFSPPFPEPGEEIRVEYTPSMALASADSLRLRVRFRLDEQPLQVEERPGDYLTTTLFPDEDGVFQGTFSLRPATAYAQLAVEDTEAMTVDANNGRLWEILTYEARGATRFESLRQRAFMAEWSQDWRRRLETTEQLTTLFPERPQGWLQEFVLGFELSDPDDADSLLAFHVANLDRLERELVQRRYEVRDLVAMMAYADLLGAAETADRWARRLGRIEPGNPDLQMRKAVKAFNDLPDRADVLVVAEEAWLASSPPQAALADLGLGLALETEEWSRAEVWARRLADLDPVNALPAGRRLADQHRTRELAIEFLTLAASPSTINSDRARPLDQDELVFARAGDSWRQGVLTRLAAALDEAGRADAAAAAIEAAADLAWDPQLLGQLAEMRLAVGDTTKTLELLARAAADPVKGVQLERAADRLLEAAGIDPLPWSRAVQREREALRRWVLETAEYRHLPADLTFEDRAGRPVALDALLTPAPTLIVISTVTKNLRPSRYDRFVALYTRLAERSIPFAVITTWGGRLEYEAFAAAHAADFPLLHDPGNLAGTVLGVSATTEYVVLDGEGVLRARSRDLDSALRLLYLLPRPPKVV